MQALKKKKRSIILGNLFEYNDMILLNNVTTKQAFIAFQVLMEPFSKPRIARPTKSLL